MNESQLTDVRKSVVKKATIVAVGVALSLPAIAGLTSQLNAATGYSVATGINGEVICDFGGEDLCPEG